MEEEKSQPEQEYNDAQQNNKTSTEDFQEGVVRTETESVGHSKKSHKNEKTIKYKKPLARFERLTVKLGTVGIIVTAITGGAIVWQDMVATRTLREMQRQYPKLEESADAANTSAAIAKSALETGERAFVFQTFTKNQEGNNVVIQVRWENTGNTPTKGMAEHVSFSGLRSRPLPDNFTFPEIWQKGEPHVPTHISVPAKGFGQGIYVSVPQTLLPSKLGAPGAYFYVWGWARYHDMFPGTAGHVSEFCDEFTISEVTSTSVFVDTNGMNACARHNCNDDGCSQSKEKSPN